MVLTDTLGENAPEVEARLDTATAALRVLSFDWSRPNDGVFPASPDYVVDLCPGNRVPAARGCFTDSWSAHRYERLGKLYLVPPGHTLRARSEQGRQRAILCWISGATIGAVAGRDLEWTDAMLAASLDVASPAADLVLHRLANEALHPGFAAEAMTELLVGELAIELCRHFLGRPAATGAGGLTGRRLRLIDERLAEGDLPSLAELAALCGLSVRQLTRGYRQSRGSSICRDMAARRIELAKRLLGDGVRIKTVASQLGFASPSSFAQAFARSAGVSPRAFRDALPRG